MAETTELPFDRPKTAREEAAAIERAKRDAEVAELRRLRNAGGGGVGDPNGNPDNPPPPSSPRAPSSQLTAAEAARRKRDLEIEQLRRLRAGENEETRKRLQERGGPLIVDMDAFRSEQMGARNRDRQNALDARQNLHGHGATDVDAWRADLRGAKDRDRRGRLEAMGNLQRHSGYYANKTSADVDRDAQGQAMRDRMEEMGRLSLGGGDDGDGGGAGGGGAEEETEEADAFDVGGAGSKLPGKVRISDVFTGNYSDKSGSEVDKDAQGQTRRDRMEEAGRPSLGGGYDGDGVGGGDVEATDDEAVGSKKSEKRPFVMFKGTDEQIPDIERSGSHVSHGGDRAPLSVSFQEGESVDIDADEVKREREAGAGSMPTEDAAPVADDDVVVEEGKLEEEEEEEEEVMVPTETLIPPTYARVDIKFSFGLIVRSSAAEGFVGGGENLRDNETLRKCMEGTSKILRGELPTPPDIADLEKRATPSSFRGMFPEAYYDPILEPTVISIEEDEKEGGDKDEDGGEKSGAKNKRTLVKASFPVFIREEVESEAGKKVYSRILKETKTTVFKSLRAAVSGGSFLKMR
jgi:hypothetical protein